MKPVKVDKKQGRSVAKIQIEDDGSYYQVNEVCDVSIIILKIPSHFLAIFTPGYHTPSANWEWWSKPRHLMPGRCSIRAIVLLF